MSLIPGVVPWPLPATCRYSASAWARRYSQTLRSADQALNNDVSPGFFAVFGIPLVRGHDFTDTEIAHRTGVVIVSQTTAHNLWPGEDAIGKMIQVGSNSVRCK